MRETVIFNVKKAMAKTVITPELWFLCSTRHLSPILIKGGQVPSLMS